MPKTRPALLRTALVAAALGSLALATPVAASGPAAGAAGHATGGTTPRAPSKVVLTNADQGTTTLVTRGEKVVVVLSSPNVRWSEATVVPDGSTPPVLTLVRGKAKKSGASRTVFEVTGYGSATLQATGRPPCVNGIVCPTYVLSWQASVVAPVVDPPGA